MVIQRSAPAPIIRGAKFEVETGNLLAIAQASKFGQRGCENGIYGLMAVTA